MNSTPVVGKTTRFLLVDDDIEYCSYFSHYAASRGVTLDFHTSLFDLQEFTDHNSYDAIILDFDLGAHKGPELIGYLAALFGNLPLYLVSALGADRVEPHLKKHANIKFLPKSLGFESIIDFIEENSRAQATAESASKTQRLSPLRDRTLSQESGSSRNAG